MDVSLIGRSAHFLIDGVPREVKLSELEVFSISSNGGGGREVN